MVDAINIDILKLSGIHKDLICPDKKLSIIILVIILKCYMSKKIIKCYMSQQWPGCFVNCNAKDFKHAFYGFTLMSLEEHH